MIILHQIRINGFETASIQNPNIRTSNNISAGVNIYASDRLINREQKEIISTTSSTRSITTPKVKLPSIEYSDSSELDKLTIERGTELEVRDKRNVALCNANGSTGFSALREL